MRYKWKTACSLSLASIMRSAWQSVRRSARGRRVTRVKWSETHQCPRGAGRGGAGNGRRARASPAGEVALAESVMPHHVLRQANKQQLRRTMSVSAPRLGSDRWNFGLMPLRCHVASMRGMSSAGVCDDGKSESWW